LVFIAIVAHFEGPVGVEAPELLQETLLEPRKVLACWEFDTGRSSVILGADASAGYPKETRSREEYELLISHTEPFYDSTAKPAE
jgi:hypothetical protein